MPFEVQLASLRSCIATHDRDALNIFLRELEWVDVSDDPDVHLLAPFKDFIIEFEKKTYVSKDFYALCERYSLSTMVDMREELFAHFEKNGVDLGIRSLVGLSVLVESSKKQG